jgi:hypothetical protein
MPSVKYVVFFAALASLLNVSCDIWWPLDLGALPVDASGYEVQRLNYTFTASFARQSQIYFGMSDGRIFRAEDADPDGAKEWLGHPVITGPRMIFVNGAGDVFVSVSGGPVFRRDAANGNWAQVLNVPVWRMTEDDRGAQYAGLYLKDAEHHAVIYKSEDRGVAWFVVFERPDNHHVHTVRWDDAAKRLYTAWGDTASRGQAYSDDRGATWVTIVTGPREGHTDVAFTRDYVVWCTDDQSGGIIRVGRADSRSEWLTGYTGFIWSGMARDTQLYVCTMTSLPNGGDRAALLASNDQGETWQKLLETSPSVEPYSRGVIAESRELTTDGWIYVTVADAVGPVSYRVRRMSSSP